MGKIDISIFGSQKGKVPVAPSVPKPFAIGLLLKFEQLLLKKHLKIRSRSRDIYSERSTTFSFIFLQNKPDLQAKLLHFS
jgi:hypothetical protein